MVLNVLWNRPDIGRRIITLLFDKTRKRGREGSVFTNLEGR